MRTTLGQDQLKPAMARLREANLQLEKKGAPQEKPRRQPTHVVYGGAHRFRADTGRKLGELALKCLSEYAPDFVSFAQAFELRGCHTFPIDPRGKRQLLDMGQQDPKALERAFPEAAFARSVYQRVRAKLEQEPVEDFRIDFEDGLGFRSEADEDAISQSAAIQLAEGILEKTIPPYIGIRIRSMNEATRERAIRTLDIFLTQLLEATGGAIPGRFVVTIPKVMHADQLGIAGELIKLLEVKLGLPLRSIWLEVMVEHPSVILDSFGKVALPTLLEPIKGRCLSVHLGRTIIYPR